MSQEETNKTERPKRRLVAEKVLTKSRAKRLFYLFKPKEVVCGEEYLAGLSIRNEDDTAFEGGKMEGILSFPFGGGDLSYDLKQVIPLIPPKQLKDIWFEPQTAESSGTGLIKVIRILPIGEDAVVECRDKYGYNMIDTNRVLTLQIASREEIYQKYSVVLALLFSVVAMTISIINAIASIIGLFT